MDVKNLNVHDRGPNNKLKHHVFTYRATHFSIETYFIWISLLIYITELVLDLSLATYYIHKNELEWGGTTLGIIIAPSILCQIYSLCLHHMDDNIKSTALVSHVFLLGIPYRYQNIIRKLEKNKITPNPHDIAIINQQIRDINAIQTLNAILQYFPQSLFQVFLIVYRRYKCVLTGISAGLAGFSFCWHVFLHFYFWLGCNAEMRFDRNDVNSSTRIIDNLSSSLNDVSFRTNNSPNNSTMAANNIPNRTHQIAPEHIATNLKNFDKPVYSSHDKNLMSKRNDMKSVEKNKIFGLNKRKPIYEKEQINFCDSNNISTVFFELDDSNRLDSSVSSNNKDYDNFINENNFNLVKTLNECKFKSDLKNINHDQDDFNKENESGAVKKSGVTSFNRNSALKRKRKGICSSQEMLHLVDIINDSISPEQVDILAKSLVELGGDESLRTESEHEELDHLNLVDNFPPVIDEQLLENIDAAIYENQIIFQERIKKNQLTIQNLKLQDQILSKFMADSKAIPCNEILSIRDYENMCFTNISRQNRGIKHWRNYLNDIDTNNHDNSTVQHSSFYVNTNTLSNSFTDLYINETEIDSINPDKYSESATGVSPKTSIRWPNRFSIDNDGNCCEGGLFDSLYVSMTGCNGDSEECNLSKKNILVETINKINVDSPLKKLVLSESQPFTTATSIINHDFDKK